MRKKLAMQREINPVVAGVIIFLLAGGLGFFVFLRTGGFGPETLTPQQNPMPKEAGEMMAKMMAGITERTKAARAREAALQQANQPPSGAITASGETPPAARTDETKPSDNH